MALRKFSKYMKVVSILVIISFVLSAAYAGYSYLSLALSNRKEVLLVINGDKIYKQDYEKELNNLKANFEQIESKKKIKANVPEELLKEISLYSLINQELIKSIGRSLKIEVNNLDVNERLKQIENQYGGKDHLVLALTRLGSNLTEFKANIKEVLIYEKTLDKMKQQIRPNDNQLEELYHRYRYTLYESREFDEVKEEVTNQYYEQNLNLLLDTYIQKTLLEATINTKDAEIEKLFNEIKKVELSYKELNIYRYEMYSSYIGAIFTSKTGYTEELFKNVKDKKLEEITKKYELAKFVESKGIKAIDELNVANKIKNLIQNYYYHLVDTYKPKEEEIQLWFSMNKEQYSTPNTISGEIIGIKYVPNEEDFNATDEKAKELIKEINAENFSQKAKELSKDPGSAKNGGDLGWSDIRSFVPEFSVATTYAPGSIIGPVRTRFGSHIIYVEDKDPKDQNRIHLKHILLKPEVSEKTKLNDKKDVLDLITQIKENKLTWDDIAKDNTGKYSKFTIREQFSKKQKNSSLPIVGYDEKLMKELFSVENGTFIEKQLDDAFVMIQKTNEIPYKKATLEEFRERVITELGFVHANNEIMNYEIKK